MYAYKEPYNYPYGKYLMIKKFRNINEQILEKVRLLVSYQEITIDEDGDKHLLFKEGSPFDNIVKPIETEIQNVYGNIFEGYEWSEDSSEADETKDYIRNQYYLTAIALKLFKNLSPIEAAFESAFLEKILFFTHGHLKPWVFRKLYPDSTQQKSEFLRMFISSNNCLDIYLEVKYLEQLGLSKNTAEDKKMASRIRKGIKKIEEDMKKRKLTKEEWQAREKTKHRYYI